nr:hypothetical protein [Tanacetum cinerariifolium]
MPENGGIAKLALQGGSGEGYGSLPTDFGVVEGTKRGGKGVCKFGMKGCTVHSDAHCFKYRDGVTGVTVLGLGNIGPCGLIPESHFQLAKMVPGLHFLFIAKSALVVSLINTTFRT